MNYQEAKVVKQNAEESVNECSEALKKYPKGDMGMVPDDIRNTEQYQIDKNAYDAAFKRLQKVNQWFMKNFKKEYMEDRKRGCKA